MKKIESNKIFRSIPQMLNNHLPGSIRSFGSYNYLLKMVYKEAVSDSNILDVIYNDLIYNLSHWGKESINIQRNSHVYDGKKTIKLSDLFNIERSQERNLDPNIFNENILKGYNGFKKNYIIDGNNQSDFIANEIAVHDKAKHYGEYFPHTFKCSLCDIVVYSEQYPQKSCCNNSRWIQLSVFYVSPDGRIDSVGNPNKKGITYQELYCKEPGCKGKLTIKESNQAKNYKFGCSVNKKHEKSLTKNGFIPYSVFSRSSFNIHSSEVINFDLSKFNNQQNNSLDFSDEEFENIINSNKKHLDEDSLQFLEEYNNGEKKNKRIIIKLNKELFKKNSQSIHLDLSAPEINRFCHNEIIKKINVWQKNFTHHTLINFESIGLIDDIEVINYSYGFTRISDIPIPTAQGQIKFNFFHESHRENGNVAMYENRPSSSRKQIFYSKENNKGIYFKIDRTQIEKLVGNTPIPTEGMFLSQKKIYQDDFEKIFVYLHSLAHYFIKTISQHFSGINTSSLSEMIFPHQFAFVIYKTGTGKDLGYLESFFEEYIKGENSSFYEHINNGINLICPAFELCNGSCIECLLTNKHSCKYENEMLDRKVVLGATL